jgi:diketogulonate reductase-like aldo/keto reductase
LSLNVSSTSFSAEESKALASTFTDGFFESVGVSNFSPVSISARSDFALTYLFIASFG